MRLNWNITSENSFSPFVRFKILLLFWDVIRWRVEKKQQLDSLPTEIKGSYDKKKLFNVCREIFDFYFRKCEKSTEKKL